MQPEPKAHHATGVVDRRQMVGILSLASREALYGHSIVHDGWIPRTSAISAILFEDEWG